MENIELEQETRRLRNLVFNHTISDVSWNNIKHQWMQPKEVQWLRDKAKAKGIPLLSVEKTVNNFDSMIERL